MRFTLGKPHTVYEGFLVAYRPRHLLDPCQPTTISTFLKVVRAKRAKIARPASHRRLFTLKGLLSPAECAAISACMSASWKETYVGAKKKSTEGTLTLVLAVP